MGGFTAAQIIGQGGTFVVTADARAGERVVLVRHSDKKPRCFIDAGTALKLLRDVGFGVVSAELAAWQPGQGSL
ncbi:hypothetical protein LXM94_25605 [Rhizobium sp. TRM95111]|nr:hypothetical protein [Rhizobium alarense]